MLSTEAVLSSASVLSAEASVASSESSSSYAVNPYPSNTLIAASDSKIIKKSFCCLRIVFRCFLVLDKSHRIKNRRLKAVCRRLCDDIYFISNRRSICRIYNTNLIASFTYCCKYIRYILYSLISILFTSSMIPRLLKISREYCPNRNILSCKRHIFSVCDILESCYLCLSVLWSDQNDFVLKKILNGIFL